MKRVMILILTLALTLSYGTALAMPIQSPGGAIEISATARDDGEETTLELDSFQLVAMNADGSYVIYADNRYYDVDPAQLQAQLSTSLGSLTVYHLGALETLVSGTRNDAVMRLQVSLSALGYLEGSSDGIFGTGTENAIKAFQAAQGMEETGEADELLQLLAQSMAASPVNVELKLEPEEIYAAILGRTNVDLQPVLDSGLPFEYDDMTGEGFISDGTEIFYNASGASDIEKYRLTVRFGLLTREDELGGVDLLPAAKVTCLCIRRPVLDALTVKAGASRGTASFESLDATLSGVDSLESGVVLLDEKMVDALAGASDAGELKLRLTGQYNTFDFAASDAQLASLTQIGQLAQQLREE